MQKYIKPMNYESFKGLDLTGEEVSEGLAYLLDEFGDIVYTWSNTSLQEKIADYWIEKGKVHG